MQNILLFHCTDDFLIEHKMTSGKSSWRLGKTNVLQSVRDQPEEIQRLFHWWTSEVLVVWDMLENSLQKVQDSLLHCDFLENKRKQHNTFGVLTDENSTFSGNTVIHLFGRLTVSRRYIPAGPGWGTKYL